MLSDIFIPLCRLLTPNVNAYLEHFGPPLNLTFDYCVDLPAGIYSLKEVLNYCCVGNLTESFAIGRDDRGVFFIEPIDLYYGNPLAPPRVAAMKFWEIEIGKPANGTPNTMEISTAMSDTNPRIRWAARSYLAAARQNYQFDDLGSKINDPEKAIWEGLGIEDIVFRGIDDSQFGRIEAPWFAKNLAKIQEPGLALLTSLEQAREKQDTGYLDAIVNAHKFSEAEIASIKPNIYRLAHESKLALDKLKSMKLNVPDFSQEALRELEDTNLFTLVPAEEK